MESPSLLPTTSSLHVDVPSPLPRPSQLPHSMQRSVSNISSTSSDIHVASNPANPSAVHDAMRSSPRRHDAVEAEHRHADMQQHGGAHSVSRPHPITARLQNGRILIITAAPKRLAELTIARFEPNVSAAHNLSFLSPSSSQQGGENPDGPNARGTYSKEYTLRHPETQWIHRGQGRYLPVSQLRKDAGSPGLATTLQHQRHVQKRIGAASLHMIDPTRVKKTLLLTLQRRSSVAPNTIKDNQPSPTQQQPPPPPPPSSAPPASKPTLARNDTQASAASAGATPEVQRRKRRAAHETLQDSLSPVPVYGLRHRPSLQPTPLTPSQQQKPSQRPSRRVKSLPGSFAARAFAFSDSDNDTDKGEHNDDDPSAVDIAVDDEDLDDDDLVDHQIDTDDDSADDMANDDDEQTFTRDYVLAHPTEKFHHVGNGWYKRGRKAKASRAGRTRDPEDNIALRPDGTYTFDPSKTIHGSQLEKFPGIEFHHTGNGWYKIGPMPSAKRTSITIPPPSMAPPVDHSVVDDAESMERMNRTVSKEYTLKHPETEWVHRGNGRYIAKDQRGLAAVPATNNAAPVPVETRLAKDDQTVDKAYVEAHPGEAWHHVGNGRYRRGHRISLKLNVGPPPSSTAQQSEDLSTGEDDPDALYDKEYVDAHPHLEFHHRGQGRYKRGPRTSRPSRPSAATVASSERGNEEEPRELEHPDALVDTQYVEAHPHETFHHKGQGRWARGMPPPGSSNKTAVRGPGAKARAEADKAPEFEDEQPANEHGEKPPGLTALVFRADGPDKWPDLDWHYRGGGKWSRMTKVQWDQKNAGAKEFNVATFSRYKPRGANHIPTVRDAMDVDGGDEEEGVAADAEEPERQPFKRRRHLPPRYGATQVGDEVRQSSNSQSDAPTPKRPMLAPEDDVLAADDLPDLYRGSFSPVDPSEDDQAGRLYRAQFRPLNVDALIKALTKHEPAVRPTENLIRLSLNTQEAMQSLQDEYLELERITAPHSRIPRRPAKGGRLPVPPQVYEDRKEADLYDYNYDPRKVGYQDPIAQRIVRDAEGRELRKRRARHALEATAPIPGWDFGDITDLAPKRQSRQPTRFDGTAAPQSTRRRGNLLERTVTSNTTSTRHVAESETPDRAGTPASVADAQNTTLTMASASEYQPPTTGRWAGHVPKRIRELRREDSVSSVRSDVSNNSAASGSSNTVSQINGSAAPVVEKRKGRPPGSKNHHKRKDAGIKKGPRKPKVPLDADGGAASLDGNFGDGSHPNGPEGWQHDPDMTDVVMTG